MWLKFQVSESPNAVCLRSSPPRRIIKVPLGNFKRDINPPYFQFRFLFLWDVLCYVSKENLTCVLLRFSSSLTFFMRDSGAASNPYPHFTTQCLRISHFSRKKKSLKRQAPILVE